MKYTSTDVDDLTRQMSLEEDQFHGEDNEFSFKDVEEKRRHPCGDVDDLIRYQNLELIENNYMRETHLTIIGISMYLNPYVQMSSAWERVQSDKKTEQQELVNVIVELVLGRTNKGEKEEEQGDLGEKPVVCGDTETKVRVYFKKNILIVLLSTAERPVILRTENTVYLIM